MAEAYSALQHHDDLSKKDDLPGLRRLFADGGIEALGAAAEVLVTEGLAAATPGFVDRLIYGAYTDDAGETVTLEKAAGKMKSVRVL